MESLARYLNLLIVDDEVEIARLIEIEIGEQFCSVHKAKNGAEGLEIARKERIDILISDKVMPVMDGLELIKRVHQDIDASMVKIIMTGYADLESAIRAFDYNAFDFVLKPLNWGELNAKVQRAAKYRIQLLDQERQLLEILGESRLRGVIEELNSKSPEERRQILASAAGMLEMKRGRYLAVRSLEQFKIEQGD